MDLSQLHFARPLWFLMLLAIPLVGSLFFLYYQKREPLHQLEKFIDKHLLSYLLVGGEQKKNKLWTQLLFWTLVWCFLCTALAGPRWNFSEIATFTRSQNLVVLLDLSESMNAKDISPSRLGRAKQKIEDLLNLSKGVKIGLIAFAADPHMIVPMTEDKETIRHLLPSLDTDLVYVQGSKLTPALEMAATMFENEPGNNKAIVVISDGGFEDVSVVKTVKKLAEKGIVLYSIGVGTSGGAPFKNRQGVVVKKNGSPIISKLEKEKFSQISNIGHGRYFDADHSEQISLIFQDLEKRSDQQKEQAHKTHRFWQEHFYLFLLPALPFFLIWYRRGYMLALFLLMSTYSEAAISSYFYNNDELAKQAYERKDYTEASQAFEDPYRKGVIHYRMGDYAASEEMFKQSTRPEVAASAAYNLGNALALQNKLEDAIEVYEEVLERWPDHTLAKENLELVKKMLEQQQENNQNSQEGSDKDKNSEGDKSQETADSKESSEGKESEQSEEKKQQPKDQPLASDQKGEKPTPRSQEDLDADLWLDQIKNDPKSFLKNKFYLESQKNGTKEDVDPW